MRNVRKRICVQANSIKNQLAAGILVLILGTAGLAGCTDGSEKDNGEPSTEIVTEQAASAGGQKIPEFQNDEEEQEYINKIKEQEQIIYEEQQEEVVDDLQGKTYTTTN